MKKKKQLAMRTSRPEVDLSSIGRTKIPYVLRGHENDKSFYKSYYVETYKPRLVNQNWSQADVTVPDLLDRIEPPGDLPQRIPKDYKVNRSYAGTDLGDFNDISNPRNIAFQRETPEQEKAREEKNRKLAKEHLPMYIPPTTPKSVPKDLYNEEVQPLEVSAKDRKAIDNYLKKFGKTGGLKKIVHYDKNKPTVKEEGAGNTAPVYFGNKYARDDIVPKTKAQQIKAGYKEMGVKGTLKTGIKRLIKHKKMKNDEFKRTGRESPPKNPYNFGGDYLHKAKKRKINFSQVKEGYKEMVKDAFEGTKPGDLYKKYNQGKKSMGKAIRSGKLPYSKFKKHKFGFGAVKRFFGVGRKPENAIPQFKGRMSQMKSMIDEV